MTGPRKHLALSRYTRTGAQVTCSGCSWTADFSTSMRDQGLAHRQHRIDMGETVAPLKPRTSERLSATHAALDDVDTRIFVALGELDDGDIATAISVLNRARAVIKAVPR